METWSKWESWDRPRVVAEIRYLTREHGQKAIERLVALMHSKNENVAVRAIEALLDRGYGRPTQEMELSGKDEDHLRFMQIEFVEPAKRTDLNGADHRQEVTR